MLKYIIDFIINVKLNKLLFIPLISFDIIVTYLYIYKIKEKALFKISLLSIYFIFNYYYIFI